MAAKTRQAGMKKAEDENYFKDAFRRLSRSAVSGDRPVKTYFFVQ
jgi:hypothetical protein